MTCSRVGHAFVLRVVPVVLSMTVPCPSVAQDGSARPRIDTVVYSGQQAPGTPGLRFVVRPPGAPLDTQNFLISPAGRVVFEAGLSAAGPSSSPSLWTWQDGAFAPVARAGDPMPGGGTFTGFGSLPAVNRAGDVAFVGGGGADVTGLFLASPAGAGGTYAVRPVLRSGQAVETETVARVFDVNPVINAAAEVSFAVGMESQARDGGFTFLTTGGGGGRLATLLRSGRPDPAGTPVGGGFIYSIDDRGRTTVLPTGPAYEGTTVYHGPPGGLRPIAAHGTPVPDPGMEGDTFKGHVAPAVHHSGLHALHVLTERSHGIWLGDADGVRLVAARGNPAPGVANGTFGGFFGRHDLNGRGQVAFTGGIYDVAPDAVYGIWTGSPGTVEKVIAQGDPLPGTGGTLGSLTFSSPHLSERGDVAFLGSFDGTGFTLDHGGDGIWAGPPGDLRLVAQQGDAIELAAGLEKTIDRLFFPYHARGGRHATSFSDAGDLLFQARFTDGTYALLVARVPEPGRALLCVALCGPPLLRRRR